MIDKLEHFMELGGVKKDVVFLIISGAALLVSLFDLADLPFDAAWIAIIPVSYTHLSLRSSAGICNGADDQRKTPVLRHFHA